MKYEIKPNVSNKKTNEPEDAERESAPRVSLSNITEQDDMEESEGVQE